MAADRPPEATAPKEAARSGRGGLLAANGFVFAVLSLALGPILALVALVLGVLTIRRGGRLVGSAIVALALFGVAARIVFLVAYGGAAYTIPSEAMRPTLEVGDRVLALHDQNPARGTIVFVNPPTESAAEAGCEVRRPERSVCPRSTPSRTRGEVVKRTIAVAGDRVRMVRGRVEVNGGPLAAPRCSNPIGPSCDLPAEVTVPTGHVFLLGDDLDNSYDSRLYGPIPILNVRRRALVRYWPPGRLGGL